MFLYSLHQSFQSGGKCDAPREQQPELSNLMHVHKLGRWEPQLGRLECLIGQQARGL